MQAVDGLGTSDYLKNTAIRNIEGEISFEEADSLLQNYYRENPTRDPSDRTEEADKVSARIAKILSEKLFLSLRPNIFLFIKNFSLEFILMQEECVITILQRKNGF